MAIDEKAEDGRLEERENSGIKEMKNNVFNIFLL